jgi:translation elongation factor P/translation initiation factor 5A
MLHFVYVVRTIETVMMGRAGHVVRVEVINVHGANTVAKKLKERDHFRHMFVDDNTKTELNEIGFAYANFFQLAKCRFE